MIVETWYQRQGRLAHAFADAVYQRWINEAVFAAAIKLPWPQDVPIIVGYDPQKLLPSPETIRPLTMREWSEAFIRLMLPDFQSYLSKPIPMFFPGDEIVFSEPRTGRYIPSINWNKLYGDELTTHRPRERTYEHKIAIVPVDYASIELRLLAHDRRIRGIVIDVDAPFGSLETELAAATTKVVVKKAINEQMESERRKNVSTAAGKRDKSYLKHDRTKQHRRRR